jgi:prepilin-type N-terminal cleavage/methylation domain-containing protein
LGFLFSIARLLDTLPRMRRGFTLIELLVVIAIIGVLIGILLPSLAAARLTARSTVCATRLQQIGVGISLYWNEFDNQLPQCNGPLPGGGTSVIGSLFAGKKGKLPFYGINTIGAMGRPLNKYVVGDQFPPDSSSEVVELQAFRSPVDKGSTNTGVPIPGLDKTDSMYDLVGCSYTLNDHTLDGEDKATLVPINPTTFRSGGKMPPVVNPARTWMAGTQTIYNFQQGGDRGMRWFGGRDVQANLLYVDLHSRSRVKVPQGVVNTTDDYTFLPS